MSIKINDDRFYSKTKFNYPPFKNGRHIDEFFLDYSIQNNLRYDKTGRMYIPAFWTAIENNFKEPYSMEAMQKSLNEYIEKNKCDKGYFTISLSSAEPLLKLPPNTIVYDASFGNAPIPLIYEDNTHKLERIPKKQFRDKKILCSFVGRMTHDVRRITYETYKNNKKFVFSIENEWNVNINNNKQDEFVNTTLNSKFCLAPRGFGRSSFRFYEAYLLGAIPVYVYDDIPWISYLDIIDYSKCCVIINIKDIKNLEKILENINETKYNEMLMNCKKYKIFDMEFFVKYIYSK